MNYAVEIDWELYIFGIVVLEVFPKTSSLLKIFYSVLGRKKKKQIFCKIMSPWLIWGLEKFSKLLITQELIISLLTNHILSFSLLQAIFLITLLLVRRESERK